VLLIEAPSSATKSNAPSLDAQTKETISTQLKRLHSESGLDEKEGLKRLARESGRSKSELYRELQRERAKCR